MAAISCSVGVIICSDVGSGSDSLNLIERRILIKTSFVREKVVQPKDVSVVSVKPRVMDTSHCTLCFSNSDIFRFARIIRLLDKLSQHCHYLSVSTVICYEHKVC
jgi:hypothetical protein